MVEYDNDKVIEKNYEEVLKEKYSPDLVEKIIKCIENKDDTDELEKCLQKHLSEREAKDETMMILGFIILG
jgi:hypothetical protein